MIDLAAAVAARFSDSELAALGATVTQGRNPQEPKLLTGPRVVFRVAGGPDVQDRHGGAIRGRIEVKVWGHEETRANLLLCLRVAQRVSELFLARFEITGGGTVRPSENPGWQQVEDTDPMTVHLHNGFDMLYWSPQRVAEITT